MYRVFLNEPKSLLCLSSCFLSAVNWVESTVARFLSPSSDVFSSLYASSLLFLSSAFTSNPVWLMIFKIDKKCTIFWTGGTMPQNPNATWCNDLHVVDGVRLLDILYLDHPVEEWWCRRKWEHYWRDFYQRLILLRFNLNTIRMSAAWGGSTCCKCH